jgi:hypothetical protein
MADPYYLVISFRCDHNDAVAPLARRYRAQLDAAITDLEAYEAAWFLEALSERSGDNPGPKGGMSVWGMVTNKLNAADVVHVLKPFWEELITLLDRVLVMYQRDEGEGFFVYDIGWDGFPPEIAVPRLAFRHYGPLPFGWGELVPPHLGTVPDRYF